MDICVVIPTVNSKNDLAACLQSLKKLNYKFTTIVVMNGTTDGSQVMVKSDFPNIIQLNNITNLGFAGGVNTGIRYALANNYKYIALLNNDAVVHKDWLKNLTDTIDSNKNIGITASKIIRTNDLIDTTGEFYTNWLLPYPRGRDEKDDKQYDKLTDITSASGGASIYRASMFEQIGLFDEDFFAYYEDVDISLRAQHAGWKIVYEPRALVIHQVGGTSGKIKGFTTYQTTKNLPLLAIKNVPKRLLLKLWPRFCLSYLLFIARAATRGHLWYALKGWFMSIYLTPKKMTESRKIIKLSASEFDRLLVHDLPPNATALRKLRKLVVRR
jgi:GT2 family glycosyltransferase